MSCNLELNIPKSIHRKVVENRSRQGRYRYRQPTPNLWFVSNLGFVALPPANRLRNKGGTQLHFRSNDDSEISNVSSLAY